MILVTFFLLGAVVFALYRVCDRIDFVGRAIHEHRAAMQSIERDRNRSAP